MLRYVYGQDEIVARFVAQMIPHVAEHGFGECRTIGVIDGDGKLIAGIVYHGWRPEAGTIEISGAALPKSNWLTRHTLALMYDYPFLYCDCQMSVHLVPADNIRLLRQLAMGGHMFITIPRVFGRGRDGVICLLTRESWESNPIFQRVRRQPIADMQEAA